MRTALAVGSAVVAVVLGAASSLSGQEGVLRYRWTKGEVLRYRVVQETNAAMTGVPGLGEMNVRNVMTQVQEMTTKDVAADGTATVQNKFESMRMEMGTPMGTFVYDSTQPPDPNANEIIAQIAASMGAMIGESITLMMSPNGAIQKIEGMSAIMEKLKKTAPSGAMGALGGLDSMLTDDAMKGSFGQGFGHLPTTPVKAGDSWKNEITMPNPFGTMTIATNFSLKGVETIGGKELARIASTATIKAAPGATPPPMPMPMTIQFTDGTGQGEMLFDRKLGRTQKTTFETTLPMTMSMTAPDGSALNMSALTKTTMTMELIEK
ncbi:MAG TPA: DUF6263 family protein [Vicinamibacterales bacterium]|nr:DUF6263 family protein [Vicinamibacterales bacterium]